MSIDSCREMGRSEYVDRLVESLEDAFSRLATVEEPHERESPAESAGPFSVEWIANFIYDSMTTPRRVYHNIRHIFDVLAALAANDTSGEKSDPIAILAILFHDVVYYKGVDQEFSSAQAQLLSPWIVEDKNKEPLELGRLAVVEQSATDESSLLGAWVMDLYEVSSKQHALSLDKAGINEFLSALAAMGALQNRLCQTDLKQLCVCIEATIPFRPTLDDKTPMDRLYDKLAKSTAWDECTLVQAVQRAATVANCDLAPFASTQRAFFLDTSWRLHPEAVPSLLVKHKDGSQGDLEALVQALNRFVSVSANIPIENLFQSFRGLPSKEKMEQMKEKARENVQFVHEYTCARLLGTRVRKELGGTSLDPSINFLSSSPAASATVNSEVLQILRESPLYFAWDPPSSLDALFYEQLGNIGVEQALKTDSKASLLETLQISACR